MQQITAVEILWRIFTLVESDADLVRASRLNKFIGAAALDVLWNDIRFETFLSLFPTRVQRRNQVRRGVWTDENYTSIVVPLLPKHWQKANPYARRVKTLRRSDIVGMEQILTSLKLYDRGSETPCIFPRLQRLIWDGPDIEELPLIANLFFHPTLKYISIRNDEYWSSGDQSRVSIPPVPEHENSIHEFPGQLGFSDQYVPPSHHTSPSQHVYPSHHTSPSQHVYPSQHVSPSQHMPPSQHVSPSQHVLPEVLESSVPESSLSVPFSIISACQFPALTRLYLPIPTKSSESLSNYHTATIRLLYCFEWQLEAAGVMFSRDILYFLGTFPKLHSLELYDLAIDPSESDGLLGLEDEDDTSFKNLRNLTIRNLRSPASLTNLEYSQCIPSHHMKFVFSRAFEDHISQHHGFYRVIHLLSQKATLESLEVEGPVDLTVFLESLLALSNLKELILGPGVTLNIGNDMLRLMSTKWRNLVRLSINRNEAHMVSLSGIASLSRCPIQLLRLSFILTRNDIDYLHRRLKNSEISPLHSLKHFHLTGLVNHAGGDIARTVLVLAYLFPRAQFIYESTTGEPDNTVQEVLRIRQVVLEILENPDIVGLSQIQRQ